MDKSPMPQIVIIADDLTGAADAGAYFGQVGLVTMVALTPDRRAAVTPPSNVLVVTTESRHLARDEAIIQVRRAAGQVAAECQASWVYKKIDSTLRGHPEAELAAVMDTLGLDQALVAPAFPSQGRTTRDGQQRVNGNARHLDLCALFRATAGGRPVQRLGLDVVRRGPAAASEALHASAGAITVADAETDADLATLAGAAVKCGLRLLCGSAGLARALADALPPLPVAPLPQLPGPRGVAGLPLRHPSPHGAAGLPLRHRPRGAGRPRGMALVVAGSRHPRTARQVESARRRGAQVVRPSPACLDGDDRAVAAAIQAVTGHLTQGRDVVLTTLDMGDAALGENMVAAQLGRVARAPAIDGWVKGLVLTGGDIAAAVCSALAATTLWLRGEVQPGIAWGMLLDGALPGLAVITKAGGFGSDDALEVAIGHLHLFRK
jgi:uncharacterized protein YgbK (DUF1537 family)